jgi:murein DD-endopeptidase MepM/ murein hydrolase activator NlpD
MSKVKFQFDKRTLTYRKVEIGLKTRVLRVLGILASASVFAVIVIVLFSTFFDSPKEKQLKREIAQLELRYKLLNDRMLRVDQVLAELQEKDDNIYRVIFEAEPIPLSIRDAGFGGVNRYQDLEQLQNSDLVIETTKRLDKLTKKLVVQSRSFDEVVQLAKNKEAMLRSIPAIQPVSNEKLTRIASGFNYRIHPIYKIRHFHTGIDFTAPRGTEIYATGDGTVTVVDRLSRGYGNHVVINHGYGYETLYAHMSRFNVKPGQKVKRGDVIGYVGSTGTSTAPHCHYEVIKNGEKINPINFFFNDLSAEEYDKVLEISNQANQSFD